MDWIKESSSSFWENLTLNEISGSLGDLGTFLPLLVGFPVFHLMPASLSEEC